MKKLSEAIREGVLLSRPTTGQYIAQSSTEGSPPYACALGAAYIGLKKDCAIFRDDVVVDYLRKVYPELQKPYKHPVNGVHYKLKKVITDLNDTHEWGRVRIAKWLESEGL